MQHYYIWTLGCQMNVADSQRLASELEKMGLHATENPKEADVLVVNTCVVRQGAEEKGVGRIHALNALKRRHPEKVIGVMGCMVGVRDPLPLRKRHFRRIPFLCLMKLSSDVGQVVHKHRYIIAS